MATTEQLDSIAELGAKLLSVQLALAEKTAEDALGANWPLGYCFGSMDALTAHYNIDQYTEGVAVITIAFIKLAGKTAGPAYLGKALDLQEDQAFREGLQYGGNDMVEWLRTKGNFKPLFLMNYFMLGRPKPL
jgi:hypothetical protein